MKRTIFLLTALLGLFLLMSNSGCDSLQQRQTTTDSGVKKATVKTIETNADGYTVEQDQIARRLINDNKVGALKHLYIISPYSGDVIIYSTVKGKVTSSGKRLQPKTVIGDSYQTNSSNNYVQVGNKIFTTNELIQDDGTNGDSDPYIYWWDTKGVYHQHFMTGGQIIHISDQPLNVKSIKITIN